MRTVISILRQVTGEVGLPQPTAVFSSTEGVVIQLRALLQAACDELADEFNWQGLIRTGTTSTVADQTEYDLPTDMLRELPITRWNIDASAPTFGNTSPQRWAQMQATTIGSATEYSFRLAGNKLVIFPAPPSGVQLRYQYVSSSYVIDGSTGEPKQEFTQDADKTIFHDRCLTALIKLKLLQAKGFDTVAAADDFNATLEAAKGGDTPAPLLSVAPMFACDDVDGELFLSDVRVPT